MTPVTEARIRLDAIRRLERESGIHAAIIVAARYLRSRGFHDAATDLLIATDRITDQAREPQS